VLGEEAEWSLTDHLLALIADHLAAANWQRSGKGPCPKPLPRPGVVDGSKKRMGNASMTLEQARVWAKVRHSEVVN
jgi:hypothetical protein